MPHSSGGGSHSGGSSGGGFSGGGSHGNGGFNDRYSSSETTYKHYVPGARTFVCYNHGRMDYVYANYFVGADAENSKKTAIKLLKILAVVTVIFLIYTLACSVPPAKIKAKYDTAIVIEDNAQVLDGNTDLKSALEAFYNETGITPAIMTVHNEDWQGKFNSLSNYAYELYVNRFSDEYHWLLVYSEPVSPDPDFNDWYWVGMQGDNTDKILNGSKLSNFNQTLQKYLTASSRYSVSEAFEQVFKETTPTIRKIDDLSEIFLSNLMLHAFIAVPFGGIVLGLWIEYKKNKSKKYIEITQIPKDQIEEDNCEYCGGLFIRGKHLTCPHCGAVIKAKREEKNETQ